MQLNYIPEDSRLLLLPIPQAREKTWDMYKQAVSAYWTAEEVTKILKDDKNHYESATPEIQHFIKRILMLFSVFDDIVNTGVNHLRDAIKIPEVKMFFDSQTYIENVHVETYVSLYLNIINPKDFNKEVEVLRNDKIILEMTGWLSGFIDNFANSGKTTSFAELLFANACVEGVFFSGAFCAIFWLQKSGIMPALAYANELISRDESMHTKFYAHINTLIKTEYQISRDKRIKMLDNAVNLTAKFIDHALPINLIEMNAKLMLQYVKTVADCVLVMFNEKPHYCTKNPFVFMEQINLFNKTNFFEKHVAEYMGVFDFGGGIEVSYKDSGEKF